MQKKSKPNKYPNFKSKSGSFVPPTGPEFQDKEERRLILLAALEQITKFHEQDRKEKTDTIRFYVTLLGGGTAFLIAASKLSTTPLSAAVQLFIVVTVIAMHVMLLSKLFAVRVVSNEFYTEYTRRIKFLVENYMRDLGEIERNSFEQSHRTYYKLNKKTLIPKNGADTIEIQSVTTLGVIFSGLSFFPIKLLIDINQCLAPFPQMCGPTSVIVYSGIYTLLFIYSTTYLLWNIWDLRVRNILKSEAGEAEMDGFLKSNPTFYKLACILYFKSLPKPMISQ
jgi:hypothetical protein